ncbi:MAG: hypothetical protein QGF59_05105, partial [Pirellulaceae bacterium]|nr:hypothetical protein [Pirellulaceae bacterium]
RRMTRIIYGAEPQDQLPFLISEGRSLERQLGADVADRELSVGAPLKALQDFQVEVLQQRATHLLRESVALKTQEDVDRELDLTYVVGRGLTAVAQQLRNRSQRYTQVESDPSTLEEDLVTEWTRLRALLLHAINHVESGEGVARVQRIASLLESELDELRLESHDNGEQAGSLERLGSVAADGRRFSRALRGASGSHAELTGPARRTSGLARRIFDIRNDRILRGRLERLFSRRLVVFWESLVFWLIISVLFLIVYDQVADTSAMGWTMWVDTGICCVLMLDFLVRLALTPERWRYFFRNALTDFLPSLPLGFLANLERVGWISGVRALRLIRVFRVLRFLRPFIRLVRLMLFAIRAMDRVVARNARWLNRNIVFFADPDDDDATPALVTRVREMDAWVSRELNGMQTHLPLRVRLPAAERRVQLMKVTARHCTSDAAWKNDSPASSIGSDVDVEDVVELLRSLDDTQVADLIGPDVARQITSSLRFFRLPFLRRLPVINFVLGPSGAPDPLMTTARLGRVFGEVLRRIQRCVLWFADL